jgi:hypothetical protein
MMHKSAAQKTWSLARSLDMEDVFQNPYKSIIRYTSHHLQNVSLVSSTDYLSVLKHLRDRCPNLRRLAITSYLLGTFNYFDQVLGSILERLKEFKVETHFHEMNASNRLLAVLSHRQNIPSIVHLDLGWRPPNVTGLKALLSKFPALTSFRMPLRRVELEFTDFTSDIASREHGKSRFDQPWLQFCIQWIAAMSHTKIGVNLIVFGSANTWSSLSSGEERDDFVLSLILRDQAKPDPVQVLQNLAVAGLTQPIEIHLFMNFICAAIDSRPDRIKELLEYLLASTSAAVFLPQPQELILHLRNSISVWSCMASKLSASALEEVVKLIGSPLANPTMLFSKALMRVYFDPSVLNFFKRLNIDDLSELNMEEYFDCPLRVDTLKWLLNHFGGNDPKKLAISLPDGAWARQLVRYHELKKTDLANALVEYFVDIPNVLYSFPVQSDFIAFAQRCKQLNNLEDFKRAVEATGPHSLSPATRARVLYYFSSSSKHKDFRDYWTQVIFDGPEPDFVAPLILDDDSSSGTSLVITVLFHPYGLTELYPILIRFKDAMLSQLRGIEDVKILIRNLAHGVLRLETMQKSDSSLKVCFDSYRSFLEDIIRIHSAAGHCPSSALMPPLYHYDRIDPLNDIVCKLFDFAHRLDFSPENARNHAKCVLEMIHLTFEDCSTYENPRNVLALVSLWIDKVTNQSVAEVAAVALPIILQERDVFHFDAMESVIEKLVRCGGLLPDSKSVESFDPQALQIYRDAVNKTLPK